MSIAILLPEQVIPFLQHDDEFVRSQARNYFSDSYHFGPLTADHYWAAIDRFGQTGDSIPFAASLGGLPQTDASLHRLVAALVGDWSDDFKFHFQKAARDMDLAVLLRNRDELLSCPQLPPIVREHLEHRLALLEQPPLSAWDQLMAHGRELADSYFGAFNPDKSEALAEAAARGGAPICELAMNVLDDKSAAEDWREIFAVRVLGEARHEPAIDALVAKLDIDADVLREAVIRALSQIATPRVIERLVEFYPGKRWDVRLYAHAPVARIKSPQSVPALLELLKVEAAIYSDDALAEETVDNADDDSDDDLDEDDDADLDADSDDDADVGSPLTDSLLTDLTLLGSLAGLERSRELIATYPDDPEVLYLRDSLLATAIMNGVSLSEEAEWRKSILQQAAAVAKSKWGIGAMVAEMRENWRPIPAR